MLQSLNRNENLDWDKINSDLKLNGYEELTLKFNENDELYFDQLNGVELRRLLSTLLNNLQKRNEVIRESLDSNDKLKWQLRDADFLLKRYETTIKNLNGTLTEYRTKIEELQTTSHGRHNDPSQEHPTTDTLTVGDGGGIASHKVLLGRYHNLEEICQQQRQQINQLQVKLDRTQSVEDARIQRQRHVFQQIKNKVPNVYNALDKRLLDIIDCYEHKICQLEKHLVFFSNLGFCVPMNDLDSALSSQHHHSNHLHHQQSNNNNSSSSNNHHHNHVVDIGNTSSPTEGCCALATIDRSASGDCCHDNNNNNNNNSCSLMIGPSLMIDDYKSLIKRLQHQMDQERLEKQSISDQLELVKLESRNKPSVEEMKQMTIKLRQYKSLMDSHNIRPNRFPKPRHENSEASRLTWSGVDWDCKLPSELELMPGSVARRLLSQICTQLNVRSVNQVFTCLVELTQLNANYPSYFALASKLTRMFDDTSYPPSLRPGPASSLATGREQPLTIVQRFDELMQLMDILTNEICALPSLVSIINQLYSALFPWSSSSGSGKLVRFQECSINQLIGVMQQIIDQCNFHASSLHNGNNMSNGQAQGLIQHLCTLFDWTSSRSNEETIHEACREDMQQSVSTSQALYSQINRLYSRYCEINNVIGSIKSMLGIDERVQRGLACIVAELDSVLESNRVYRSRQLSEYQLTNDIEILVGRLERYEEFIPEFQQLVVDIIQELGLETIDDILPRIKSLQMASKLMK